MSTLSPRSHRWLHLWFDRLSINRAQNGLSEETLQPSIPFALIVRQGSAIRLDAVDPVAEALNLQAGLTLAAARARVPELRVENADPAADALLLARLAEVCRRYTPAVALDPPDALNLDITGAAHLFGGESGLLLDIHRRFERSGLSVRTAAAATPAAAFAFARFDGQASGSEAERLAALPVSALRLDPDATWVLHRLGLRRIGQVQALPRSSLALRLGPKALDRLDAAFGLRAEALAFVEEIPPFMVEARLAEPVSDEAAVLALCLQLAGHLSQHLQDAGVGGRQFGLELFRVDGAVKRLEVQASRALISPARIAALFHERLAALNEGLEADFGFDLLRLWAVSTDRLRHATAELLAGQDGEGDFLAFLDRVRARFGANAVQQFVPASESRLPENAIRRVEVGTGRSQTWSAEESARYDGALLRPLTLFSPPHPITATAGVPEDPPVQFVWRRVLRMIVRAEGPERMAAEWWRTPEAEPVEEGLEENAASPIRDYYRLEDGEGRRYWVFREGLYAPGVSPRWFLHGLFA